MSPGSEARRIRRIRHEPKVTSGPRRVKPTALALAPGRGRTGSAAGRAEVAQGAYRRVVAAPGRSTAPVAEMPGARYDPPAISGRIEHARSNRSCCPGARSGAARRKAADLVVWWEKGYYAQEDEAVREIVAAFEQESGKQVELVFQQQEELPKKIVGGARGRRAAGLRLRLLLYLYPATVGASTIGWWISRTLSATFPISSIRTRSTKRCLLNAKTGRKALYGLPIGRSTNHLHVWKSLLEQAGFTLADIPKEWDAFWSFWCDQVQPAVRRATGRDDIWGIGCPCRSRQTTPDPILPVHGRLPSGLRDPRRQARHR